MESSNDETNFLYAWQIASMVQVPMILKTAIELGLLEILGQHHHPMSPTDIASHLQSVTNPDAAVFIDRILRVLATYNIVTCVLHDQLLPPGRDDDDCERRLYGPAPVGKFFTKNKVDGGSLASVCLTINDEVYMGSWFHLKEAIVEGKFPFNCVHGMTPFEYASRDVRFNKVFNQGVADKSTIIMTKILETYTGFDGLTSLVDVGGGTGVAMRSIVSKYPSIKGIVFDLPHVIAQAPPHPGVEHVGGDMLVSVPKGDAIFMKSIIHDWSDESCIIFLKNCYKSLPEDSGKVIVAEFIMPTLPDPNNVETKLVVLTDCLMMALTPGGKERTKAQFEGLAKASGFTAIQVACCAYGTYIIEFLKTP